MRRCHLVEIQLTQNRDLSPGRPCYSCCRPSSPPSGNTSVSIVSAVNDVQLNARALGQLKANALHVPALPGADTVGKVN